MRLTRRTFLQKASLGLATLGLSEIVLSLLGDNSLAVPVLEHYFQALAQPSGRKLALLVGINQYPHSTPLGGCVTDVELQRELLIHRFGFQSSDILTLTDGQASRENIETAFVEHLTKQAKAGDVVVFHFSGYGSRVKMNLESSSDELLRLQNSLVPIDGILATKETSIANDLLEDTLTLLVRSLATDRVTMVLDTSHTNTKGVLQGNLRVRSCPNPPAEAPSPGELAFQEQLRLRSIPLVERLKNAENSNPIPGIVLTAASPKELATEALWNGFSAGLFTYALTQYLWQAAPATTVQISLSRAAGTLNQLVGQEQQPQLKHQKSQQPPLLTYYLPLDPTLGADGVVTGVEENGKVAQLWLAGLPATVLGYYGSNSILSLYPKGSLLFETGEEQPQKIAAIQLGTTDATPILPQESNQKSSQSSPLVKLQIRSKEGLTARAKLVGSNVAENYQIQEGQLVREAIRILPRNVGLTMALDAGLERIERVDATSAFATIPAVSSVVNAGEQSADYVFGKEPLPSTPASASTNLAATRTAGMDSFMKTGGYGLFYLGYDPIRSTTGEVGEAVKSAVNRLSSKLDTLLAAKLLRLTANEGSSHLGIRASLEIVSPEPKLIMQREPLRVSPLKALANQKIAPSLITSVTKENIPSLPIGSSIQYRLENYSSHPIYFMILGLNSSGNAIALYKIQSSQNLQESDHTPPLKNAVIEPGETLTLPYSMASSNWVVPGPAGLTEIQLICSQVPFKKAIAVLESARRLKGEGVQMGDLFNPLEVSRALLQDLHNASAVPPESINMASDVYALDVKAWATLSFIYRVV